MRKAYSAGRVTGGHTEPESDDEETSSGPNNLLEAVAAGQVAVVRRLIAAGASIESRDKYKSTLLHLAASKGHTEIISLLLQKRADIHARDGFESTPLHRAAQNGQIAAAQLLLRAGADVNELDKGGRTPLQNAASDGNVRMIQLLLQSGAYVDSTDSAGLTPLQMAYRKQEAARILLQNGANVAARGKDGKTVIHRAISQDGQDVVRTLLQNGANVNERDGEGKTPLHYAAELYEAGPMLQFLQKMGADVNARTSAGFTILHSAALHNNSSTVSQVMKLGVDVNAVDNDGYTALMAAARKSDSTLGFLVGSVPLLTCIFVVTGDEDTTKLLIKLGANINAQSSDLGSALHVAAYKGRARVLRILIDKGAYVNARCGEYGYAIQAGAFKGNSSVVRNLVNKGANINAPGGKYLNAIQAAVAGGSKAKKVLDWLRGWEAGTETIEEKDKVEGSGRTKFTIRGQKLDEDDGSDESGGEEEEEAVEQGDNWWKPPAEEPNSLEVLPEFSNLRVSPLAGNYGHNAQANTGATRSTPNATRQYQNTMGDSSNRAGFSTYNSDPSTTQPGYRNFPQYTNPVPVVQPLYNESDHNTVSCDICDTSFPKSDAHYHCIICNDGDFDICQQCKDIGHQCPSYHQLYERRLGVEVEQGHVEGGWEDDEEGFDEIICDNCDKNFPKHHAQYVFFEHLYLMNLN